MALPSSGQLSINDIVGEFGGSAPHSLSEYYRGGSLVPNTSNNSSVPTSGQIKITDFYGAADNLYAGTVTNGYTNVDFGFLGQYFFRGFKNGNSQQGLFTLINSVNFGSVDDSTVDFLSGANLIVLAESTTSGAAAAGTLNFEVSGSFSNSGFSTLKLTNSGGSNTFNRTDASYLSQNGTTSWSWSTTINQNPFGTNGANITSTTFEFN